MQEVQHELRPGLELGGLGDQFGQRSETGFGDGVLAGVDARRFQIEEVNDAEMDAADGRSVVVDEAKEALLPPPPYFDLLEEFAAHPGLVSIESGIGGAGRRGRRSILFANVTPNADRAKRLQPLLRAARTASVVEEIGPTAEHDVGDELLEVRVGLDFGTR